MDIGRIFGALLAPNAKSSHGVMVNPNRVVAALLKPAATKAPDNWFEQTMRLKKERQRPLDEKAAEEWERHHRALRIAAKLRHSKDKPTHVKNARIRHGRSVFRQNMHHALYHLVPKHSFIARFPQPQQAIAAAMWDEMIKTRKARRMMHTGIYARSLAQIGPQFGREQVIASFGGDRAYEAHLGAHDRAVEKRAEDAYKHGMNYDEVFASAFHESDRAAVYKVWNLCWIRAENDRQQAQIEFELHVRKMAVRVASGDATLAQVLPKDPFRRRMFLQIWPCVFNHGAEDARASLHASAVSEQTSNIARLFETMQDGIQNLGHDYSKTANNVIGELGRVAMVVERVTDAVDGVAQEIGQVVTRQTNNSQSLARLQQEHRQISSEIAKAIHHRGTASAANVPSYDRQISELASQQRRIEALIARGG